MGSPHGSQETLPPDLYKCGGSPVRAVRSVPEEQHSDQDEDGGNDIPDKVHPMDALTATVLVVFVVEIKVVLFHPRLLHRHCGEALHLLHEHEAGLVFLILDQLAVADDLAQLGDH